VPALGLPLFSGPYSLVADAYTAAPTREYVSHITGLAGHWREWVKAAEHGADTHTMMISKQQARAAAAQLNNYSARMQSVGGPPVSAEVLSQAFAAACNAPATDVRRVADARTFLARDAHNSRDVAEMMIQRIVSDALR